jgi:hypothetical protein
MATMYENVCGNCVDRIELAFLHIKSIHVGFSLSRSNNSILWQCDFWFKNALAVYVTNTG